MHLGVGDRDFHADMRTRQGPAGHFRVRAVLLPGLCHADGCLLRRRPRLPGRLASSGGGGHRQRSRAARCSGPLLEATHQLARRRWRLPDSARLRQLACHYRQAPQHRRLSQCPAAALAAAPQHALRSIRWQDHQLRMAESQELRASRCRPAPTAAAARAAAGALLIQKLQPPVTAASSTAVEPAAGGASGVGAIR